MRPEPGALSQPAWGALIGIGLNANLAREDFPPELAAHATSLQIERRGAAVDRSELARELIRRLDHWYDLSRRVGPETLSAAWCQRSEHLGKAVSVETSSASVVGRLVDLDVRFGVTLELCGAPGSAQNEAPIGPPLDLVGRELPLARPIDGENAALIPAQPPEGSLSEVVRLPLSDIRSIEPVRGRSPLVAQILIRDTKEVELPEDDVRLTIPATLVGLTPARFTPIRRRRHPRILPPAFDQLSLVEGNRHGGSAFVSALVGRLLLGRVSAVPSSCRSLRRNRDSSSGNGGLCHVGSASGVALDRVLQGVRQ